MLLQSGSKLVNQYIEKQTDNQYALKVIAAFLYFIILAVIYLVVWIGFKEIWNNIVPNVLDSAKTIDSTDSFLITLPLYALLIIL